MSAVSGILAEPDLTPHNGQQILMNSYLVPPYTDEPRHRLLDQDMGGALLFLESITPGGAHVHGSAFLVAPGIALTAWHTIEDWINAGHFDQPGHTIFASGAMGAELRVWQVRACKGPTAGGDVAMLILAPRFPVGDEVKIFHFQLAVSMPALGSRVLALGSRLDPPDEVLPLGFGEKTLPIVSLVTIASTGLVEDRYFSGVPRIKAPCFAANVFSLGGMSGGPVFDEDGYVIGIVSESFAGLTPDECVSLISSVWPALLFDFEGVWPQGMFPPGSILNVDWVLNRWRIFATESGELAYLEGGDDDFIGPPNCSHLV